ncbi:uncharacterized protein DUF4260 [Isoptericola sp. CG 20/1183]|uniref:Uncharacterized protein DUF4260 n=2 Tax=Promicromonosporaceae TaxID=85017 RepID=A0ABX5EA32_9MICO|nr:uncharacterized protein DUF4260 [Isoptericola sp. CG 20/1183]PRZ03693.1 uncharacterized protein DUF4260 [Isoptericola halotolerans]
MYVKITDAEARMVDDDGPMSDTDLSTTTDGAARGGLRPATIERIENGLVVVLAVAGTLTIEPGLWWFPLAVFLAFDLSMVGYLRSPAAGAATYNAVHTYVWPLVLAVAGLVAGTGAPTLSRWLTLVSLAWAFHVGLDRALGYGLKLADAFTHTHLGWIGKDAGTNPR